MRDTRRRRKDGLRVIPLEIRDAEIDTLIRKGWLPETARNNRDAIAVAMGDLLDVLKPGMWPMKSSQPMQGKAA